MGQKNRSPLDYSIEVSWLLALGLVPLVFSGPDIVVLFLQPKDFVLHFFALLILSLVIVKWSLRSHQSLIGIGSVRTIRHWLGRNPANWSLASAAGFAAVVTVSTILSPLPFVSLWGRDFASLGYEMYSVLSLLVIFFAVALGIHSEQQVRRILWVIVGAGIISGAYGISQHFGWDHIGYGAGQTRVIGSFGNPIFFGSYLVMSSTITIGLALDKTRHSQWHWLPVLAVFLGVQLAALWFTGSRGPWIGSVVSLVAFGGLGAVTLNKSSAVRSGATILAGVAIAGVIVNIPWNSNEREGRGIGSIVSGVTPTAIQSGERADIWKGSVRLIDSWETQPAISETWPSLQWIFGLGPEMYYYSYPLVANPQLGLTVPSHAHNFPLQVFLELGLAGLVTFTVLSMAILFGALAFLRRQGRTNNWLPAAMLVVIASLLGRGAEQMVGIAQLGDLVAFWALLGVVVAIYRMERLSESGAINGTYQPRCHKRSNYRLVGAAVLLVVMLSIFFMRDIQSLRSGVIASNAFEESKHGNRLDAVQSLHKAADISPWVEQYSLWGGQLLIDESRSQVNADNAIKFLVDAHDTLLEYVQRNPMAFTSQLNLGLVEAELVNLGDGEMRSDLILRSLKLADSMPAYPTVQAFAAERVLIAGELEMGLELADRAIAMEGSTSPQPLAWFTRGNALGDLGYIESALEAFKTALDHEPDGLIAPSIHRNMATAYDSIGDAMLAAKHRARAKELEGSQGR